MFRGLGFRGLGFRALGVQGLGFRVLGLEFRFQHCGLLASERRLACKKCFKTPATADSHMIRSWVIPDKQRSEQYIVPMYLFDNYTEIEILF